MKTEATYHLKNFIENLGYFPQNIQLFKIKQSNKKPCYMAHFDLEKCSISGFIFQDDHNEWIFNLNQSSYSIDKTSFISKVKEAEFLRRKAHRTQVKQEKINLSENDIRGRDIEIKKARQLKKHL